MGEGKGIRTAHADLKLQAYNDMAMATTGVGGHHLLYEVLWMVAGADCGAAAAVWQRRGQ